MPCFASLFRTVVLLCIVTAMPATACAANAALNTDIVNASSQLAVGLGVLHQDYTEYNHGMAAAPFEILDAETGSIPALQVDYGVMLPHLFGQVALRIASGDTTYDGYLVDYTVMPPTYTPWKDTTSNTMVDFLGRVGYPFRAGGRVVLVPYGELGSHYWERDVGYIEDYTHFAIGIGGKVLWSPAERVVIEGGLSVGTTLFGNMSTGGENFALGDRPYWSAYTSLDYRLASHWHIKAALDYRYWEYGASDADATGFYEPDSVTKQTTFLVSGGYSF